MALIKKTELDKVEVVGVNTIPMLQCRHVTWVEDDGVMIGGKSYHRHVISPDSNLAGEPAEVVAIATAMFTPAVKAAWAAKKAEVVL